VSSQNDPAPHFERICVVGAGYMGSGIGQILACAGSRVLMVDANAERARSAVESSFSQAAEFEARGLRPAGSARAVRERTRAADDLTAGVEEADLVVEAVPEDLALKVNVIQQVERRAPEGAVIATNTSSIPIAALAQPMSDPTRLIGVHWFNPPQFIPGVEVIPGEMTNPGLESRVVEMLRMAGKAPVVVRDSPGFVANRLQFALFREAVLMLEEGIADPGQIDEVVRSTFGFRLPFYGPFAIADMAGLDVYAGAYDTLRAAYGDRLGAPRLLTELVALGRLGVKQGGGFLRLEAEEARSMVEERDRIYATLLNLVLPARQHLDRE